jgi:hypothetical protein
MSQVGVKEETLDSGGKVDLACWRQIGIWILGFGEGQNRYLRSSTDSGADPLPGEASSLVARAGIAASGDAGIDFFGVLGGLEISDTG